VHDDLLIHPHPNYQRLGTTREQRCAVYCAITVQTLFDEDSRPSGSTCNANTRLDQITFVPPPKLSWRARPEHKIGLSRKARPTEKKRTRIPVC